MTWIGTQWNKMELVWDEVLLSLLVSKKDSDFIKLLNFKDLY